MRDKEYKRPELGEKISFTATAQKDIASFKDGGRHTSFWSKPTDTIQTGVYVGYRRWTSGTTQTVQGIRRYQVEFVAEVWLVVTSPARNPIPVFRDDCFYDELSPTVEEYLSDLLNSGKD